MKHLRQYFGAVFIVVLKVTKIADSKPFANKCGKLPDEKRMDLLRDLSDGYPYLHWSFSLLPFLKQAAMEELPRAAPSVTKNFRETFLYGENRRMCPKQIEPGMKVCPVHYVIQHDENRIPENIVHARCNCKHCSQNESSVVHGKCVKEYAYTPVWRRTEDDCDYRKHLEYVAVTCVCKMSIPRMIQAQK